MILGTTLGTMSASILTMKLSQRSRHQLGFSLVELMIVVAIIGVLATLGSYGVRSYMLTAKTSEAVQLIGSIRAAEEEYKSDAFVYLGLLEFSTWHPEDKPENKKYSWARNTDGEMYSKVLGPLGIEPSGAVSYAYGVVAGGVGDGPPKLDTDEQNFNIPSQAKAPWYIVMAKADLDGDGVFTYMLSHSDMTSIHIQSNY